MGGVFGTIARTDCVQDLFFGTDYHSHLGTKKGGLTVVNDGVFTRSIHSIENSYFRTKFEPDLPEFKGNAGIGVISDTDNQPILIHSHHGFYGIVTVAKILNMEELSREILGRKMHFSETTSGDTNPTELIATLINDGDDMVEGIVETQEAVKGSCTLLVLTPDCIYAARDKLGRTPLVIGKKENGYAVASESSSFPTLGYQMDKFLGPGEVVRITADGHETLVPPREKMQICAFLWVYYGYPATDYEGINVEKTRYRCGAALARKDKLEADFVAGIPDSGVGHAIGYANEKRIPYMRPYVKYTPTWPRSFMPESQQMRDLVAKMKLIPIREVINGKRLVFCDDSIVRGTQLQDTIRVLYDYGASETHMRVACPPLLHGCKFLNFSASKTALELAGRKAIRQLEGKDEPDSLEKYADPDSDRYQAMVEVISKRIGLTSLRYQSIHDLVDAIGMPKERICTHCWDGSSWV
jgi:amidophosphoribosyltransferase